MSFVVTAPPVLASAASDLGGIASMISEANAMAAVRTTALAPAAADEFRRRSRRCFPATRGTIKR